jgi:hypothetical protein
LEREGSLTVNLIGDKRMLIGSGDEQERQRVAGFDG